HSHGRCRGASRAVPCGNAGTLAAVKRGAKSNTHESVCSPMHSPLNNALRRAQDPLLRNRIRFIPSTVKPGACRLLADRVAKSRFPTLCPRRHLGRKATALIHEPLGNNPTCRG